MGRKINAPLDPEREVEPDGDGPSPLRAPGQHPAAGAARGECAHGAGLSPEALAPQFERLAALEALSAEASVTQPSKSSQRSRPSSTRWRLAAGAAGGAGALSAVYRTGAHGGAIRRLAPARGPGPALVTKPELCSLMSRNHLDLATIAWLEVLLGFSGTVLFVRTIAPSWSASPHALWKSIVAQCKAGPRLWDYLQLAGATQSGRARMAQPGGSLDHRGIRLAHSNEGEFVPSGRSVAPEPSGCSARGARRWP